jgi:type I restriction enzyme, S subunit
MDLPDEWKESPISEIGKIMTGNTPPKKISEYYMDGSIEFIKPSDLQNKEITTFNEKISNSAKNVARIIKAGGVLVTCIGEIGRVGFVRKDVAFNQQINGIQPNEGVDGKFIFYRIQMEKKQIQNMASATTVSIVNKSKFEKTKVTYPLSKKLQQQIVSAIETQFSRLDETIENLKSVKGKLKVYRNAVLKKAFEKKDGWREGTMKDTGEYINGRCFKKSEWRANGIPIIRIQNLTGRNKEFNYFDGDLDERNKIKKGDLLLSWSATLDVFEWDKGEAALNQHIFKVIPKLDKRFLYYLLKTKIIEMHSKTHGTGMMHITRTKFDKVKALFPESASKQEKIVQLIEEKFSVIDKVEEAVNKGLEKAEQLRKSILKIAFEGRLVKNGIN